MSPDLRALIISYVYLLGIVFLGEIIRYTMKLKKVFTRKFIHIGVGFWGFIAFWSFGSSWAVLIPPASFIIINALSFKWALIKSMEIEDKKNLGTIYYPVSLCLILLLFWRGGDRIIPLIGLLVMALGDGFASIVGNMWGKHQYTIWGQTKSIEGSLAMFLFSCAGVILVLVVLTDLPFQPVLFRTLGVALVATLVEGISPRGTDNLSVPVISALTYWFIMS